MLNNYYLHNLNDINIVTIILTVIIHIYFIIIFDQFEIYLISGGPFFIFHIHFRGRCVDGARYPFERWIFMMNFNVCKFILLPEEEEEEDVDRLRHQDFE